MQYIFLLLVWGASMASAAFLSDQLPPPPPRPPSVFSDVASPQADANEYREEPAPAPVWQSLSDTERETYQKASKEKCLNILIGSEDRGFYYNGEPLDIGEKNPRGLEMMQARVAGDRLAYIWRDGGRDYVVVDGDVVDTLSKIDFPNANRPQLQLNQKHVAFMQLVDRNFREFRSAIHLIFDGKDVGPVDLSNFKLNGDHVIYDRIEDRTLTKSYVYIDGKKIVRGSNGDYDGKNFGYGTVDDGKLIYNGKKLGYGGDLTLKDGHRAYFFGRTKNAIEPQVVYDGKIVGRGQRPVIEKNHLAYVRSRMDTDPKSTDDRWRVVYDGREQGLIGGYNYTTSLAGNHFAYVRLLDQSAHPFKQKDTPAVITIDGEDYPGTFAQGTVYVEISEKIDKSVCD